MFYILTSDGKKISILAELIKFFIILSTSIIFFCLLFPFLKKIGGVAPEAIEHLDPFAKAQTSTTSSIYLYFSGCVIFMGTLLCYSRIIFPKFISGDIGQRRGIGGVALFFILTTVGFIATGVFKGLSCPIQIFTKPAAIMMTVLLCLLLQMESRFKPWVKILFDVLLILFLFILTFRNDVFYFDFSNFLAVINDVALGKDILANVISLYGFINIYFLATIFRLFAVHDFYSGLAIINSVFYLLGYSFIYVLLRRYTGRVVFSSLALFNIFVVHFYLLTNIPIHWATSVGFLRFGIVFPIFYLLYSRRLREKNFWGWLLALALGIASFWVMEIGIYILAAFIATAVLKYLSGKDMADRNDLLKVLLKFVVVFSGIILFLTARIYFKYGHGPLWEDLVYYQKLVLLSGSGVQVLKDFYLWPAIVLIYFVTIYGCLSFYRKIKYADAWLFLAFFGLASLLYYVSSVLLDHLARVAFPAMILFFVFGGYLIKMDLTGGCGPWQIKLKYPVYFVTIVLTLWLASTISQYGGQETLMRQLTMNPQRSLKNAMTDALAKILPKDKMQQFQYDVLTIRKSIPQNTAAAVISKHDTLYYVYSQRKSFLKIAFYPNVGFTRNEIPEAVDQIVKSQIKYVFIDNSSYQCYNNTVNTHLTDMREQLSKHFAKKQPLGLLDLYERIE